MKYRRNSDEDIRSLERAWLANKDDRAALQRLNIARQRSSLPPVGVPAFSLEWGYNAGIPDVETIAWGGRAILRGESIDIVYGSLHGSGEALLNFRAILDGGLLQMAIAEARRLVRSGQMRGDEAREFVLAMDQGILVLGNTNASHGYLYLLAYVIPVTDALGHPFEVPSLLCEICRKTEVTFSDDLCGKCHSRICDRCNKPNDCDNCDTITCVRCQSRLTCGASGCSNIICNSAECLESAPRCEMCPKGDENLLCAECGEDNKMCAQCSEAACSVCEETLFTDDGDNRTRTCELCDQLMHYRCRKQPCKCEENDEEDEEYDEDSESDSHSDYRYNPDEEDDELGGWAVVHESGDLIADGFENEDTAWTWLYQASEDGMLEDVVENYDVTEVED